MLENLSCSVSLNFTGGKLKPLKQPKADKKEYDEVFQRFQVFLSYLLLLNP